MGEISKPQQVKLVCGLIFQDETLLNKTVRILEKKFGSVDFKSTILPFNYTDYYEKEFGTGLKRAFVSFTKLIPPDHLASIKVYTNYLELKSGKTGQRRINIDPGYLDLAKLVLATTKDFSHRVYLSKGIYAEITLSYKDKSFRIHPWTYPDYRTPEYLEIFHTIRNLFSKQLSSLLRKPTLPTVRHNL
ncbi:MAG: DUF4416 family protein [Candidatus Omnitrophica bacterium]|nr:DUF4416 family protein [Candidatus Omnitrophota bacterium]